MLGKISDKQTFKIRVAQQTGAGKKVVKQAQGQYSTGAVNAMVDRSRGAQSALAMASGSNFGPVVYQEKKFIAMSKPQVSHDSPT